MVGRDTSLLVLVAFLSFVENNTNIENDQPYALITKAYFLHIVWTI